jgi:hypothetical protein
VKLQWRTLRERTFVRLREPDVDEVEFDASLTKATAFDTVGTIGKALVAFQMALSAR